MSDDQKWARDQHKPQRREERKGCEHCWHTKEEYETTEGSIMGQSWRSTVLRSKSICCKCGAVAYGGTRYPG